jgi:hypothetical protein
MALPLIPIFGGMAIGSAITYVFKDEQTKAVIMKGVHRVAEYLPSGAAFVPFMGKKAEVSEVKTAEPKAQDRPEEGRENIEVTPIVPTETPQERASEEAVSEEGAMH